MAVSYYIMLHSKYNLRYKVLTFLKFNLDMGRMFLDSAAMYVWIALFRHSCKIFLRVLC